MIAVYSPVNGAPKLLVWLRNECDSASFNARDSSMQIRQKGNTDYNGDYNGTFERAAKRLQTLGWMAICEWAGVCVCLFFLRDFCLRLEYLLFVVYWSRLIAIGIGQTRRACQWQDNIYDIYLARLLLLFSWNHNNWFILLHWCSCRVSWFERDLILALILKRFNLPIQRPIKRLQHKVRANLRKWDRHQSSRFSPVMRQSAVMCLSGDYLIWAMGVTTTTILVWALHQN